MKTARALRQHSEYVATLHAAGLRSTGPRLAILQMLLHDTSHPTVEAVYRRLRPIYPSLSLATVYNTLAAFSRRGLCRLVPPLGGRQRFDGTVKPHHHALCTGCGSIFDVPSEVYEPPPPPPHLGAGLPVHGLQVIFEVLCASCRGVGGDDGSHENDPKAQSTHT